MAADNSTIFSKDPLKRVEMDKLNELKVLKNLKCKKEDITTQITPILLDSPSCSECRVSFDCKPTIKEIIPFNQIYNKKKKDNKKFEIKDKNLIINKSMTKMVKQKAKKFTALVPSSNKVILKYKNKEDMENDMRSLGLKPKTYIESKLIVHNLSFKENEESVKTFFSQFAEVEKVILEKNKKGVCVGKGVITFSTGFYSGQEKKLYNLRLNGRLLRIERIKKQVINKTRLFISHMNKNLKISDLRSILKKEGFVPKSIRVDLNDNRNKGYGFVEFQTAEQSENFIKNYSKFKEFIGENSFVELSHEKMDRK